MAAVEVKAFGMALTGNGAADGTITVASTASVWEGAKGWIVDGNTDAKWVEVSEVVSSTTMKLRLLQQPAAAGVVPVYSGPNYGASDMSAYTTAQSARIDFPQQQKILKHSES